MQVNPTPNPMSLHSTFWADESHEIRGLRPAGGPIGPKSAPLLLNLGWRRTCRGPSPWAAARRRTRTAGTRCRTASPATGRRSSRWTDGTVSYAGGGEDYESGPGSYELTATVTDAGGLSAAVTLTVTVTDCERSAGLRGAGLRLRFGGECAGPVQPGRRLGVGPGRRGHAGVQPCGRRSGEVLGRPGRHGLVHGRRRGFRVRSGQLRVHRDGHRRGWPVGRRTLDGDGDRHERRRPAFAEPVSILPSTWRRTWRARSAWAAVSASDPDGGDALAYSLSGDAAHAVLGRPGRHGLVHGRRRGLRVRAGQLPSSPRPPPTREACRPPYP